MPKRNYDMSVKEDQSEDFFKKFLETQDKYRKLGILKGLSKDFIIRETLEKTLPSRWHISVRGAFAIIRKKLKNGVKH